MEVVQAVSECRGRRSVADMENVGEGMEGEWVPGVHRRGDK